MSKHTPHSDLPVFTQLRAMRAVYFLNCEYIFHLFPVSVAVIQIAYQIVVKSSFFCPKEERANACMQKVCERASDKVRTKAEKKPTLLHSEHK